MTACTDMAPCIPCLHYGARQCAQHNEFARWLLKTACKWARRQMSLDDAEDFASRFALLVCSNPERFLKPHLANPYQWLHCSVEREVRHDLCRGLKRRCKEQSLSEWEEAGGAIVAEDSASEPIVLQRDFLARVVQATCLLTPEQQDVLHRFAYEEETANEIAVALHTTPPAIRSRIHRIREQMRHKVLEEL